MYVLGELREMKSEYAGAAGFEPTLSALLLFPVKGRPQKWPSYRSSRADCRRYEPRARVDLALSTVFPKSDLVKG